MVFRFGRRARAAAEPVEPLWVDLTDPDTLGLFAEAAARWAARVDWKSDDTVLFACDLLVEGFDTPALRDVASISLGADWRDSREVVMAACAELGLQFSDEGSSAAQLLALRSLCRLFLTGALAEREFVRSAHFLFGYHSPAIAQDLATLEYLFEGVEEGWGRTGVNGLADRYARAFFASTAQ